MGEIRVKNSVLREMEAQARANARQECCGLLGARGGEVVQIFAARNALESATAYEIAPEDLFDLFRAIRVARLEFAGIYHSHLRGPAEPSPSDIERAYYPEAAYMIVATNSEAREAVRAFRICEGAVKEMEIVAV